jgi:hypothetical protein
MSLTRTTRRSGFMLVVLGLLAAGFFWLTDPRCKWLAGIASASWYNPRHWLALLRGSSGNMVDAARESSVVTIIGLAGAALVLMVGVYLMSRRTV